MNRTFSMLILGFYCLNAYAGEYCWNDKVVRVILKNDGIYFTSQKSCLNWCKVNPNWSAERKDQALSMLLLAKTSNANIAFFWAEHDAGSPCQDRLPAFANPVLIMLD